MGNERIEGIMIYIKNHVASVAQHMKTAEKTIEKRRYTPIFPQKFGMS